MQVGMIRRVDKNGRLVIPAEMYRELGINNMDEVEIFSTESGIVIKKHYSSNIKSDIKSLLCKYNNDNSEITKILKELIA